MALLDEATTVMTTFKIVFYSRCGMLILQFINIDS